MAAKIEKLLRDEMAGTQSPVGCIHGLPQSGGIYRREVTIVATFVVPTNLE
jgi:hypothetical protein